ncbi:MAG: hypothetical protein JNN15_19490 [Blastocatellia bacterium]|nr:hypothetical protein [Blastocatellia bacterium]
MYIEFNRNAINPIECFRQSWHLVKDQYWMFLLISVVSMVLGSAAPLGLLLGPMMCGLYLCYFKKMDGERVSFDILFKGFDFFKNSLIATLIQVVPIMVISLPFSFFIIAMTLGNSRRSGPPDPSVMLPVIFGSVGLMMGIGILIGIVFIFVFPLIADKNLSGFEAVKIAISAAFANFWGILGLFGVGFICGLVGLAFCYVGAFFILPITFGAYAVAYRQVFPAKS